jgi:hypothetical protein
MQSSRLRVHGIEDEGNRDEKWFSNALWVSQPLRPVLFVRIAPLPRLNLNKMDWRVSGHRGKEESAVDFSNWILFFSSKSQTVLNRTE